MESPANTTDPAILTRGLVRTFDDFRAVDGIDLHVPRGSFYGFLGPNGAGRSTTIKCLTGLLLPTGGTIGILGLDPLQFVGRVYGVPREQIRKRSDELLAMMVAPVVVVIIALAALLERDGPWMAWITGPLNAVVVFLVLGVFGANLSVLLLLFWIGLAFVVARYLERITMDLLGSRRENLLSLARGK